MRRLIIIFCFLAKPFSKLFISSAKKMDYSSINKILIMKNCCLGDILMSTPMVRELRNNFSSARIHYMVGPWSKEAIKGNPCLDRVIDHVVFVKNKTLWEKVRDLRSLRKERYDLLFILDTGIISMLAGFLIGAKFRVGFDLHHQGFLLTHGVPRTLKDNKHEVEWYLDLLRRIGIKPKPKKMEFFLSKEDERFAREFFYNYKLNEKDLIIGIGPGGGINPFTALTTKQWSKERYAQLADRLIKNFGAKIIFFGDRRDRPVVKTLKRKMNNEALDVTGEISLKETAALIKRCRLFITNDSGLMHLAAAVGRPTVSIFGPSLSKYTAPLGKGHLSIEKELPCRPCAMPGETKLLNCPAHTCMELITVEEVWKAAERQF